MAGELKVVCYAGYRADEAPLRFFIGTRKIEVQKILDRWLGEDHRYFKVCGDDGDTYILRHDSGSDEWELTLFERSGN